MSNNLQTITSKLWAMANELRGTMDASEYKNYILAFMFYRYLSEHQEQYLVGNNVIDVADGQSTNDAYLKQAVGADLDDYLEDISSSLGYAIAPNDTWESLINKINDAQVIPSDYQTIFDNFNKNAELNREAVKDFRGIFNDINLGDSRLGSSTNERAKSLNNIVKLVDEVEYKGDDGRDILGEIYEYLIGKFAASAGKKGGEFYTPHQVSKILAKLVTNGVEKSNEFFNIYDPTMGSGSLLLTVGQELSDGIPMKYFGQELNTTTYNLARMNLMMHNVSYNNMTLNNADTLENDWPDGPDEKGIDHPRSFDAVVANPPYSAKWDNDKTKLKDPRFSDYGKLAPASKADYAFILHSIYHLNSDGTMAIVLPHGVLFRGAAEGKIRQTLIEKNYLDTVIGLPANLFYGTSIPTVILVFKKNRKTKDILFIDASNDFEKGKNQNNLIDKNVDKIINTFKERKNIDKYAHLASIDEIKENEFNLNIPRYVDTFEEEAPIDLEEVNRQLEQDNKEIAELEAKINEQLKILGVKI
ncbi:type I restriction-modification system subunit M [Clostridium tyrobutyricum]|jgi:type I restriction enzyme M protein|uniref:site-specific DNA-methyltransferase (adenine-specific) n=4 Tax=Clostridium tyrobutyricum TaxID=1519 RepID=W6N368_CLOTY|nr:type I restriction-modification system subunit M [Clostridium tyrobutyricum]AND86002.1 type I restriction enzyme, M subunit [Clostridium tyrobutyricum]ANP70503.1 type I restriction-modification system subunit M [Clostridium tyrobutyricum]MBV4434921.1 type I restriction-modification system subunit M [Clostridium tyrobutyricum]MCH4200057.1 type I restriction-modification system subunit M [Clostridium tyrobutyricum]MCH4236642.1 type I restriction-modification system subunit M [Clostridium tyro